MTASEARRRSAARADHGETIDGPLGGVEVPALDAVGVVEGEAVVVVVVALAEGENGHDRAVARAVLTAVGLPADHVAEAVDEEGAVVADHKAQHAADQEAAEDAAGGEADNQGNAPKATAVPIQAYQRACQRTRGSSRRSRTTVCGGASLEKKIQPMCAHQKPLVML